MMQLLRTARDNRHLVESGAFACAAIMVLLATYLFTSYSRFLQGHTMGAEFVRGDINRFSTTTPTYTFISEHYFNILIAMLIVAIICYVKGNFVTSSLNLPLSFYTIYQAVQIFYLKKDIYGFENYEMRYFDVVRETAIFDVLGVILILSLAVAQIYLFCHDVRIRRHNGVT